MAKLALIGIAAALAAPHVLARVHTGAAPGGAVSAFGAVWVANDTAGTLARIDPRTNRVTRRVRLRPGVFSVARGFGALWVVNYKRNALTRVDPRSGRVRSVQVGAVPFDVLAAHGRVWVTAWAAGRLVEVDPRSLKVVRRIRIGPRPTGLHAAGGALWVGFGRSATAIARVEPATRKIERIVHVDPAKRRVVGTLSFGRTLAQGSLAPDGTLWIPDKEQNLVYRVDPAKARVVDSFPAGPGAFFALRAHGSMWVTSYAGDEVWRFRPSGP